MSVLKCYYDTMVSLVTTKDDSVVHSTTRWPQVATLKNNNNNKTTLIQWAPPSVLSMTLNIFASRSASLVFLFSHLVCLLLMCR